MSTFLKYLKNLKVKVKVLIIVELKILKQKTIKIIKKNKINIIYLFIIFSLLSIYFIVFFIPLVVLISFINLMIIFFIKIFKQNYIFSYYNVIIKYTPNSRRFVLFFLYTYFFRQPLMYGYIITYSVLFFFLNKTNIKITSDKIITILFRYSFKYTVGIPYFIVEKTIEVTETLVYFKEFTYENSAGFWYNFLLNLVVMYSTDVKILKDSKIILNKNDKIKFNPISEIKLLESIEEFLKLYAHLPKVARIVYAKLGSWDKYSRYYILVEINPELTKEGFDTLGFSVSKHPEWRLNLESDGFSLDIKKAYKTNFLKTETVENILKKKFNISAGIAENQESWITDPILVHKREFTAAIPYWLDQPINVVDAVHDDFFIDLTKLLLISSSSILAKFINNEIKLNLDDKPLLYKYSLLADVFNDEKLNLKYSYLLQSYHSYLNDQKTQNLIKSDSDGWFNYKKLLFKIISKNTFLTQYKNELLEQTSDKSKKSIEFKSLEPYLQKKIKIEDIEKEGIKITERIQKTKPTLTGKINIDDIE